jgi:AhpC/TSA family
MRLISRPTLKDCAAAMLLVVASLAIALAQSQHAFDLQGRKVEKLAPAGAREVVLVFAATDCPISNRYILEIARLNRDFAAQGVAFWWVFPNPGDTLPVVQKHGREFSLATPTLLDPYQDLVRMAKASVTPEAAVFAVKDGDLHEVYHGRIDDRYIALGKERPQASHHDLEGAIQAALAGRAIPESSRGAVGCSIIPITRKP